MVELRSMSRFVVVIRVALAAVLAVSAKPVDAQTASSAVEPASGAARAEPADPRLARDALRRSLSLWIGPSARDGDVRDIAVQPWSYDWGRELFVGASHSYRFGRFWRDFTFDAEIGGGYRFGDTNTLDAWGAFYFRYDGFPWRDRLYTAFGLSTGLHWLDTLPEAETGPPERPEPHRSKWLHYFSPELVFSLPDSPQHEVAIRYHHRSGMFGNMNGVWEGSNVLMIAYRHRY
jgi:hypothetical protein